MSLKLTLCVKNTLRYNAVMVTTPEKSEQKSTKTNLYSNRPLHIIRPCSQTMMKLLFHEEIEVYTQFVIDRSFRKCV